MRGKTKAKRDRFVRDDNYDWVEREHEMKKLNEQLGEQSKYTFIFGLNFIFLFKIYKLNISLSKTITYSVI